MLRLALVGVVETWLVSFLSSEALAGTALAFPGCDERRMTALPPNAKPDP
jgi:hypothetical protein